MKLLELRTSDFRQFRGTHRLQLAPDGDKNVTIVYGTNGAGKTTLLNAFTWCLYETVTPDFMYPKRLINDAVWSDLPMGGRASAEVTLEFEHNGDYFTLTRRARASKNSMGPEQNPVVEATLVRRTISGAVELQNPRDFVDTILPLRLHHFFFMNGERFDHLLSANAFEDIEGAIKTLLGLEMIERGIAHLRDVEKRLNLAYRKLATGLENEILERLEKANAQVESTKQELSENEGQQRRRSEEIALQDSRLRDLEGSRRLQQERDSLQARYTGVVQSRDSTLTRRQDLLGSRGFLPFTTASAQLAIARYEDMREKREIPRGIKTTFVRDLLEHGVCICGRDVTEGEGRVALESWMEKAGRPSYEESWMKFAGTLSDWIRTHLPDVKTQLADLDDQLSLHAAELNALDQRLSELSRQLGSAEEEDIRGLEDARRHARAQLDSLIYKRAQLDADLKRAALAVHEAEISLRKAQAATAEAQVAQRRVVAAQDVRDALERLRDLRTTDVRRDLDRRIKDVYREVVKKRQIPALSEKFELLLQESVDGRLQPKAKSTGEAQVLTLSFVGALADLARTTYEANAGGSTNSFVNGTGGIFPFVADAIFGTLDESFRRDVARLLPRLAPQVLLFLSKKQASAEVYGELLPRIGAVAVIRAEMARTDIQPETIEYDGREVPYVAIGGEDDSSSLITLLEPEKSNG